jgi:hypothetical protein
MWTILDSFPIPDSTVVGRIVDDEAVLVLPEEGQVKVLNEVGARIWTLADGSITIREIAGNICAEYRVEQTTAEEDVVDFIELMIKHGAIKLLDHPSVVGTGSN